MFGQNKLHQQLSK